MKVLIVGKGGREHALAWKIKQSPLVAQVFIAPGNEGMQNLGSCVPLSETDVAGLCAFALREQISLTIVGPESSLAAGIADAFTAHGLKIFAPSQNAARIESSKAFAKEIMERHNIPTAGYERFTQKNTALAYVQEKGAPIVIKEDGLKAGKGVTIALTLAEAEEVLNRAFEEDNCVVIEDYMEGFEFSLIALAHGEEVITLEAAQDHKRVSDGDLGPNTGGMGAYSPVGRINASIIARAEKEILQPMAAALVKEGIPFTGFLFGGIMLTAQGPKVIEFNARFGDPEAEALLPRMESDLVLLIEELLKGKTLPIRWRSQFSVSVVMASKGYPSTVSSEAEILLPEDKECLVFHMGTKKEGGRLLTHGGRVLAVTALGETLEEAQKKAYTFVKGVKCPHLFYRSDIGAKMLSQEKP